MTGCLKLATAGRQVHGVKSHQSVSFDSSNHVCDVFRCDCNNIIREQTSSVEHKVKRAQFTAQTKISSRER